MLKDISHFLSQDTSVLRSSCGKVESVAGPDDGVENGVISEEVHSGLDFISLVLDTDQEEGWL